MTATIRRDAKWCRIVLDGETLAEGRSVTAEEQSDIQVIHSIGSESPIHVPNRSWVDVKIDALWWKESSRSQFLAGGGKLTKLPTVDVEACDGSGGPTLWVVRKCTFTAWSPSGQSLWKDVKLRGVRVDDS
jgi:hypothetical protein